MRTTLKRLAASALVGALLAGVATGVIDPTALARALADVVGDLGGWAYAAVGGMAFLRPARSSASSSRARPWWSSAESPRATATSPCR
jgi:hypothetical protein